MLTRLLKEIKSLDGTATVSELAQRLGVESDVVTAMVEMLESKGVVAFSDLGSLCVFPQCGGSCRSCPLRKPVLAEHERRA